MALLTDIGFIFTFRLIFPSVFWVSTLKANSMYWWRLILLYTGPKEFAELWSCLGQWRVSGLIKFLSWVRFFKLIIVETKILNFFLKLLNRKAGLVLHLLMRFGVRVVIKIREAHSYILKLKDLWRCAWIVAFRFLS